MEPAKAPKHIPVHVITEHIIKLALEGLNYSVKDPGTIDYLHEKKRRQIRYPFHVRFQEITDGLKCSKWK